MARLSVRTELAMYAQFKGVDVDFKGFDSSMIFISRGGILTSKSKLPDNLSQTMLVGIMLVQYPVQATHSQ